MILSFETATRTGSVALTRGTQALALRVGEGQTSHSTTLLTLIAQVLEEAGVELQEVELFAVASGPGSFTGLRIGLATVKSFAATLERPCVGIPTLYAIAHAAGRSTRTLAMIPAGRGEVFAQLLTVDDAGVVTPLNQASHQSPEILLRSMTNNKPLKLAGEAAQHYKQLIRTIAELEVSLIDEESAQSVSEREQAAGWLLSTPVTALARSIGVLADQRFRNLETCAPEHLRAIYLRPSDAELNAPKP